MRMLLLSSALLLVSCERQAGRMEPVVVDPNPNFQATFASATRLEFSYRYADPPVPSIIMEDRGEIAHFLNSIEFKTHREDEILVCMCAGDPVVNLTLANGHVENFTLHHGSRVRWTAYETDLHMSYASATKLKEFLDRHGIVSE